MVANRDREPGVYSIHEAKTQLSRLLDQVLSSGQPVLIGRRGKAEVQLAALDQAAKSKRSPGLYRSTIKILEPLPPSQEQALMAASGSNGGSDGVGSTHGDGDGDGGTYGDGKGKGNGNGAGYEGVLLTPQTLVRWLAAPFDLGGLTHDLILDGGRRVAVSTSALAQILAWQGDRIIDLGALKGRLAAACTAQGFEVLSVEPRHIERAASLQGDIDAAVAVLADLKRI